LTSQVGSCIILANDELISKSLRAIKFAIQTMAAGQKGKKLSPF
jgi:hypothetical protein